jgi:hypothetical protein
MTNANEQLSIYTYSAENGLFVDSIDAYKRIENDSYVQKQNTRNKRVHSSKNSSELLYLEYVKLLNASLGLAQFQYANLQKSNFANPVIAYNSESSSTSTLNETKEIPTGIENPIPQSMTIALLQVIKQDDFTAGETSNTEIYIHKVANEYGWFLTLAWIQDIFLDNFGDSHILIGILHAISHFAYSDVKPAGIMMALASFQHADIFVRDVAIRAFENWNSKQAIRQLKALKCDAQWQQQYVNEVIQTLETEGIE